jgi:hypothetical protein
MLLRTLILLAAVMVSAAAAAVEVPEEWRLDFKDLIWGKGGDFVEGPSNRNKPAAIGRIEETQIVWNKQVYPISAFTIKDDKTAELVFELGTLTVITKNTRMYEGRFKELATNKDHWFRTGGWKW